MDNNVDRKAPRTIDERWRELLERMAVPNHPGAYILGCFAHHVTFHSQQMRAMNLIDALCKTGTLVEGGTIGIVGAGLAGLTATAAALRRGLSAHLFEKDGDPRTIQGRMPLQTNSDERFVDPFIYDWPLVPEVEGKASTVEAEEGIRAGLPLLDWTADTASRVRKQVLGFMTESADLGATFEKIVEQNTDRIQFYQCKVDEGRISRDSAGRLLVSTGQNSQAITVDALILAVGFGVEASPPSKARYWTNDGLAGNQADGRTYLVSGVGDGGLTDVMRLCIAGFEHRAVLGAFQNAGSIGKELVKAVREGRSDLSDVFLKESGKISISHEDIAKHLAERNTRVYLTSSPERLFGVESKASILNRLIIAWLLRNKRFKLVDASLQTAILPEVKFLRWESDEAVPEPEVLTFAGEGFVREALSASFDEVVVRHGPGSVKSDRHKAGPLEESFPTYWNESKKNRDYWKEMPHWDDWTRRPLWEVDDFLNPSPLDARPAVRTYLVVEHPKTKEFVQRTLRTVIDEVRQDDETSSASIISLDLVKDFETPHRFGRAIRALCRADVAVFDLTEQDECPEAFVLLGIRSVARRGITLVTSRFKDAGHEPEKSDAPFAIPEMPFLLSDIGVYGWFKEDKFKARLKKGIEEGLARAERLGLIYRDLPAYDEVRRLGPEPQDYRAQGLGDAILFLAPFNEKYRNSNGSWLKARVGAEEVGIYIVESASPERTSIKLYTAIRRTQLCVVDWTERSRNVFFELGVRLAASPVPPVCVIDHADEWTSGPARGIFKLFRPLVYDQAVSAVGFEGEIRRCKKALGKDDPALEWPLNGATLSPDFVYREVRAATPRESEDWSVPVWKELETTASLISGSKRRQYPDLPILFSDDDIYKREAIRSSMDRLLAAWYFLEHRYNIQERVRAGEEINWEEEPWKSWRKIGASIARELKHESRDDYVRMYGEINDLVMLATRRRR